MTAVPTAFAVSSPEVLTVATAVFCEDQITEPVMFDVEPSVEVAVAWSCCDNPAAKEGFAGAIATEAVCAAVTVIAMEALMEPLVAVTTAVP